MSLGIPSYNQIKDSLTRRAFTYIDQVMSPTANIVTGAPSGWPAIDGLEVVYIQDATKGFDWRFKYRAASASAFKWEWAGGTPRVDLSGAGVVIGVPGSFQAAAPQFIAPFAGDYLVNTGAVVTNAGNAVIQIAPLTALAPLFQTVDFYNAAGNNQGFNSVPSFPLTLTNGQVVDFGIWANAAVTFTNRSWTIQPVRVG